MIRKIFLSTILLITLTINVPATCQQKTPIEYTNVSAIELVNKPNVYLNKNVKITNNQFLTEI